MSYADPYAPHAPHHQQTQPYIHDDEAEYNPYQIQQHDGGYRDEPSYPSSQEQLPPRPPTKESEYEAHNYAEGARPMPGNLRQWRSDNNRNLWTSGSRAGCIGRFCCCIILTVLFLLISIVLSLALWIQPPNVTIGSVSTATSTSAFTLITDGLQINLNVSIDVQNPNYFSVEFSKISADIFYPINNTLIGGGNETDVVFHANTNTNISFPFDISYTTDIDPDHTIITDIAKKCIGGTDLTVDYKITLGLKILFVTISPVVSSSSSFSCPLSTSDIEEVLQELDLGDIISSL